MIKFIKKNIWEIERSNSLLVLGIIFSVLNILVYIFWRQTPGIVSDNTISPLLCWEFFPNCTQIRIIPPGLTQIVFIFFLILNTVATLMFMAKRGLTAAWTCLFLSLIIQLSYYVQDASLQSNFHSLVLMLQFCFLLIPNKSNLIRFFIFCSYLISGVNRLNPEWLSGVSIPQKLQIPLKGYEWIAVFSVLIELLMPWLLISRERIRLAYGFGALFVYHLFHFYFWRQYDQVGAAILIIFIAFEHFEQARRERESFYRSYEHPEPSKMWWPVIIGIFIAAQLPLSAHTPLTVLKLEKANAYSECQQFAFLNFADRVEQIEFNASTDLSPQLRCHPTVAFNRIKGLCAKHKDEVGFKNATSFFLSRGMAETDYKMVFSSADFCNPDFTLSNAKEIQ
ncbi:MAG: hypothetical protein AABZ31_00285 [Bdellovibrionota bacterium]